MHAQRIEGSAASPLCPAATGPGVLTLPGLRTGFLIHPARNHRKSNGRRWIRTSDFHRVRMALDAFFPCFLLFSCSR